MIDTVASTAGGLIPGVAASLLAVLIIALVNNVRSRMSPLTGQWKDRIYDGDGKVAKEDVFTLRHNVLTGIVKGEIHRVVPTSQSYRKWRTIGVLSGNTLMLIFWSSSEIASDGCICVLLNEDNVYKGKYLKHLGGELKAVRIDIYR